MRATVRLQRRCAVTAGPRVSLRNCVSGGWHEHACGGLMAHGRSWRPPMRAPRAVGPCSRRAKTQSLISWLIALTHSQHLRASYLRAAGQRRQKRSMRQLAAPAAAGEAAAADSSNPAAATLLLSPPAPSLRCFLTTLAVTPPSSPGAVQMGAWQGLRARTHATPALRRRASGAPPSTQPILAPQPCA